MLKCEIHGHCYASCAFWIKIHLPENYNPETPMDTDKKVPREACYLQSNLGWVKEQTGKTENFYKRASWLQIHGWNCGPTPSPANKGEAGESRLPSALRILYISPPLCGVVLPLSGNQSLPNTSLVRRRPAGETGLPISPFMTILGRAMTLTLTQR